MYCYNISLFLLVYSPSFEINSKIIQNNIYTIGINDDPQHIKKKRRAIRHENEWNTQTTPRMNYTLTLETNDK